MIFRLRGPRTSLSIIGSRAIDVVDALVGAISPIRVVIMYIRVSKTNPNLIVFDVVVWMCVDNDLIMCISIYR